jgi:hypothetical protein
MEHGLASAFMRLSWRGVRAALATALFSLACIASPCACSSSPPNASASRCDPSRCAPGNDCIDDGSGAGPRCRKVCTRQADCPFNFYCNDSQPKSGCVETTIPVPQVDGGEWGASCPPACDTLDTFDCYGTSPADAKAFCTLFDCAKDSDCEGGWWCATVEAVPNLSTPNRSFGQPPRTVCLPRVYCASCQMDHDCPPAAGGTPQHCVPDSLGNGFCSPQCGADTNCPIDATCQVPWGVCAQTTCVTDDDCQGYAPAEKCIGAACKVACKRDADCPKSNGATQHCDAAGGCTPQVCTIDDECPPTGGVFQHCNAGACTPECSVDTDCNVAVGDQTCIPPPFKVCSPRAGVCRGDGSFCSPCRTDSDCTNGYCLATPYSTERFCSQAMTSGMTCSSTAPPPPGSCPTPPSGANYKGVACTTVADAPFSPPNQCIGVVTFGKSPTGTALLQPGCWTANR